MLLTPLHKLHQQRVHSFLETRIQHTLAIRDTCQLSNAGIRHLPTVEDSTSSQNIVAFTLAAGAASRFIAPYKAILQKIAEGQIAEARQELQRVVTELEGAPIAPKIRQFTETLSTTQDADALRALINLPKALHPCVMEGDSFFNLKLRENSALPQLQGQIYVVPKGLKDAFQAEWDQGQFPLPAVFLEQGDELCTVRFDEQAQPVLDHQQALSLVPAGHGLLVKLFQQARAAFPKATSALIRNIDNIQGQSPDVLNAMNQLMTSHSQALSYIHAIRNSLATGQEATASEAAKELLQFLAPELADTPTPLITAQEKIFHTPKSMLSNNTTTLLQLYQRPFHILGQVPNAGSDVGGTPCFTEQNNEVVKVCLEVPHASDQDRKTFLEDSQKAEYFNPVLIMAELHDCFSAELPEHPFWLIAAKQFEGRPVFYHEELLSEILGNSLINNCVFAAMPRAVFNPHKSINDCAQKTLADWFKG